MNCDQKHGSLATGLLAAALLLCPWGAGGLAQSTTLPPAITLKSAPVKSAAPDLATRSGPDWPRFLGPNGDGKSGEKLALGAWPESGPPIVWSTAIGEGYSAPSISRGRLFLFDRVGDHARLRALNAETGAELWRSEYETNYEDLYEYSGGPRTSPLIDGDRVYVYGVEGALRAHAVSDGRLLWQVDTAARFGVQQNFFGVGSTPAIEADLLLVMVGGSPPASPGVQSGQVKPNGSAVVAFDKHTGEVRYRVGDDLASYASIVVRTIGDRRWAFAFARSGLLAFEPSSGARDFQFPWKASVLESVNAADPVVVGDAVFLTETYGPGGVLLRVKPGGYDTLWQDARRDKVLATHWNTPIYHRGYLYGSSGRNSANAELRAVEFASLVRGGPAKVAWSQSGLSRSTLLYLDEHFIVLTEYGRLLLIDAVPTAFRVKAEVDLSTGTETRPAVRHPAWNPPVLARGLLYVRGKDTLVAFDLAPQP